MTNTHTQTFILIKSKVSLHYSNHLMTDVEEKGEKQGERFGNKSIERTFLEDHCERVLSFSWTIKMEIHSITKCPNIYKIACFINMLIITYAFYKMLFISTQF